MKSRQERVTSNRHASRRSDLPLHVGDAVYVMTTGGEFLAWEQAVEAEQVGDSRFLVKVKIQLRFVSIDLRRSS